MKLVLGALCVVLAGCARASHLVLDAAALPFATDTLRTAPVADGAAHHFVYAPSGPWAIHVLDVRLDRCLSAVAVKGSAGAIGRTKTSELMRGLSASREVIGGVNADFFLFDPPGVPVGALVSKGRVIAGPSTEPVFAIDSTWTPRIATLSVRGGVDTRDRISDSVVARLSLAPFHPREAVGGRPQLTRDSLVLGHVDSVGAPGFATNRHPRTAVGIANGGKRLLFVVVDGRQAGYSAGMTLRELANLMLALGAPNALNLDGGGSTTMVVRAPSAADSLRVANRPSDPTGERSVGDALAIVRDCKQR